MTNWNSCWFPIMPGTPDMLSDYLCENFDIDKEVAANDIERQIAEWKEFGLLQ